MSVVRRAIGVRGIVQGVGFRPFVFRLAERGRLGGFVRNVSGEVEIEIEGETARVDSFVGALREEAPPLAVVAAIDVREVAPRGDAAFVIQESEARDAGFRPVSPDAATCPDCVRELFDPGDRRHRYPFLNCTNCGPRFTIIDDLPYDRPKTSMAGFRMCADCHREYEDPRDRRFHAQPVACPACGPRLFYRAAGSNGAPLEREAALAAAEELLRGGGILALKGLGGFQLVCDARREEAVARLRDRKRRTRKPLAIMVRDLGAARALCAISAEEERALRSSGAPIVVLARRGAAGVAPSVAPGLATLGVMLPYTPLHHLLLSDLDRPLVMTSGNLSEEPIAIGNEEALGRLDRVADGFLFHDREIRARYDDSVVRQIGRDVVPFRRARGIAPAPVRLEVEADEEVLALGAHQKNTFCFLKERFAFLGQHVGDLENAETLAALREGIAKYRRLFRLAPRAVAHDLHPDYLSTAEAARIAREEDIPLVAVQHHHAHLAACLAEHGRDRAIGLIFDGTGLGTDGAIWGGEVLLGDFEGFERRGHLAPIPLPGGARAIERPARMALAALLERAAGREDLIERTERVLSPKEARIVRYQVATGLNAPRTTSMGRLFDAAAVLLGLGPEARYEGELAVNLESLAATAPARAAPGAPLPFPVAGEGTEASPAILDPGPLLVALVERCAAGEDVRALAAAFHAAVAGSAAEAAMRVAAATGVSIVALSGGCFQNRILAEGCRALLERAGLEVLTHRVIPPNDGGIALGQAVVAATLLRRESGGR